MTDPLMQSAAAGQGIVGLQVPAQVGMRIEDIATPALVVDLPALERNIQVMGRFAAARNISHRAHAKMHKSADVARLQMSLGGAVGVCCQKVSEAQALIAAGIDDVLVSNQVTQPRQIGHLVTLSRNARVAVCVDDADNAQALSDAAVAGGVSLCCLVEIDVGARRCGVPPGQAAVRLATLIDKLPGLEFTGLQAYQGSAQHLTDYRAREQAIAEVVAQTRNTVQLLEEAGLRCDTVTGAGSGSYYFEAASGVYTELQCGSYAFMDAAYQSILDEHGKPVSEFANSLFVLTTVMSVVQPGRAICDAGLKAHSVDSGMPVVFDRADLTFLKASDEHGVIDDPDNALRLNDRLMLVPGHCDPTCNLYDWYVAVRDGVVEHLWPVTARGRLY